MVAAARDSMKAAEKVLDQFIGIDKQVPWTTINKKLSEFDDHNDNYSPNAAALIGKIQTHLMNGIDEYFEATHRVSEWAALVAPLLKAQNALFNGHNAAKAVAQQRLFLKVLRFV